MRFTILSLFLLWCGLSSHAQQALYVHGTDTFLHLPSGYELNPHSFTIFLDTTLRIEGDTLWEGGPFQYEFSHPQLGLDSMILNMSFSRLSGALDTIFVSIDGNRLLSSGMHYLHNERFFQKNIGGQSKTLSLRIPMPTDVKYLVRGFAFKAVQLHYLKKSPTYVNQQEEKKKGVSLFPNPTTGSFNISISSNKGAHILIFNSSGQLLKTHMMSLPQEQVEIPHSQGVYFVEVQTEDAVETFRLIKR